MCMLLSSLLGDDEEGEVYGSVSWMTVNGGNRA